MTKFKKRGKWNKLQLDGSRVHAIFLTEIWRCPRWCYLILWDIRGDLLVPAATCLNIKMCSAFWNKMCAFNFCTTHRLVEASTCWTLSWVSDYVDCWLSPVISQQSCLIRNVHESQGSVSMSTMKQLCWMNKSSNIMHNHWSI